MDLVERKRWNVVAAYYFFLYERICDRVDDVIKLLVSKFAISKTQIYEYLKKFSNISNDDISLISLQDNRSGHSGGGNRLTDQEKNKLKAAVRDREGRHTIREIGEISSIPKSTVQDNLQAMGVIRYITWVKPALSEHHLIQRIEFILSRIDLHTNLFCDMYHVIHVDECWFYLRQNKEWVRLLPGEEPYDPMTVHHKGHIPKIMFLIAITRPRYEYNFNGAIGLWRICNEKVALRKTSTHKRGEVYLEDCNVNAAFYRQLIVGKGGVMETIRAKMPWMRDETLYIQHDGASAHNKKGNKQYFASPEVVNQFNIHIITQPPQSPDLNANDLGFIRSLKKHVDHSKALHGNLQNMIETVEDCFDCYDSDTMERIFAHLVENYRTILKIQGGNNYSNPHSNVRKRQLDNAIVVDLHYDVDDCALAQTVLNNFFSNKT